MHEFSSFPHHLAPLRSFGGAQDGLGGRNFRLRVDSASRSFAQAAQILNDINTKSTKVFVERILHVFRALVVKESLA
jgi:hypothetical protein